MIFARCGGAIANADCASRVTKTGGSMRGVAPLHETVSGQPPRGAFLTRTIGRQTYKLYIPTTAAPGSMLPLVLMLHGCTQNADDFAAGTEMNIFAEHYGLLVAYPEQPAGANRYRCWNWFRTFNQARDSGEPAALMAIVAAVRRDYPVDPQRIYVAGLSAGAAMAVILGSTYPDVFAAVGVSAGVAYRAAVNLGGALFSLAGNNGDARPKAQAALRAMGRHRRVVPLIAFQGSTDKTVRPAQSAHLVEQWLLTARLAAAADPDLAPADQPPAITTHIVPAGRRFTEVVYSNRADLAIVKHYLVEGMGHAWSGGSPAGSYTDPRGPNASRLMIDFFLERPLGYEYAALQPAAPAAVTAPPAPPAPPAVASPPATRLERLGRTLKQAWNRLTQR